MKFLPLTIASLGICAVLGACNSNETTAPSAPTQAAQERPVWSIKLKSTCDASVSDNNCVGKYGFTVFSDGRYQLGPAPDGQVDIDALTPEEFDNLKSLVEPILATSQLNSANHESIYDNSQEDVITLTKNEGGEEEIITAAGSDFSYRLKSFDHAKELHDAIITLANKHYLLPYPNPCRKAITAVHELYKTVQSCESSEECAFINNASLEVVPEGSTQSIFKNDCHPILPLYAANMSSLRYNKDKIAEAKEAAKAVCGEQITTRIEGCKTEAFILNENTPVCKNHVCQSEH